MYYPCFANGIPENKIMITGNCQNVKQILVKEQIRKARNKNFSVIIIDYVGKDFSNFFARNGYPVCHSFTPENSTYKPLDCSVKEETLSLRSSAKKNDYSPREYSSMTVLIKFLNELEKKCGSVSGSVDEMLKKFKNQRKFEDFLKEQVINKKIKRKEATDYIQSYLEYIPSGVIADILAQEQEFMLNGGENVFSLSSLNQGEAAILHADMNENVNEFLSQAWTQDIIKLSKTMSMILIINGGFHSQIRLPELISALSKKESVGIMYCSFDIFSGCEPKKAESFSNYFQYVIYGQHTGSSAKYISDLFGEKWVYKYSYTAGSANNFREEWLPLFSYETSMTKSTSTNRHQVKTSVLPQDKIINFSKKEYILVDKIENRYFKGSVV